MQVKVNGRDIVLDAGLNILSVAYLLDHLKIAGGSVAVEKNGVIIDRSEFGKEELSEGDVIEIVRFVGGG